MPQPPKGAVWARRRTSHQWTGKTSVSPPVHTHKTNNGCKMANTSSSAEQTYTAKGMPTPPRGALWVTKQTAHHRPAGAPTPAAVTPYGNTNYTCHSASAGSRQGKSTQPRGCPNHPRVLCAAHHELPTSGPAKHLCPRPFTLTTTNTGAKWCPPLGVLECPSLGKVGFILFLTVVVCFSCATPLVRAAASLGVHQSGQLDGRSRSSSCFATATSLRCRRSGYRSSAVLPPAPGSPQEPIPGPVRAGRRIESWSQRPNQSNGRKLRRRGESAA